MRIECWICYPKGTERGGYTFANGETQAEAYENHLREHHPRAYKKLKSSNKGDD